MNVLNFPLWEWVVRGESVGGVMARTTQLRTYTIREGLLEEWAAKWREFVVPLRLQHGFEIGGAWLDHERSQFVWVIAYEGPESFEAANKRYWALPERAAMDLDPKDYLVDRDVRVVEQTY
jgi:hypothetical protein